MRRWLVLAVALLGALAAGCGESSVSQTAAVSGPKTAKPAASADGATLRVGVQKDGIRSILEASGALKGLPYEIEWSTFQFGPPLVEAASADKIDVAGVGSTPPIFGLASARPGFRVIAQLQYLAAAEDALLVPKGSSIRDAAGLRGKSIAVAKGSSAHGFILNYLKRNGLSTDDVKLEFLAPADGLAAFTSDRVDSLAAWPPFVTQAEAAGGKRIAGGPPDEDGYSFVVASTKAVQDPTRAAALRDYMVRLRTAFKWARQNPDKWAAAWTEESGLPLQTTKVAVRERAQRIGPVTDPARQSEQKLADVLVENKAIPKRVTFDDIVTTGLAPTPDPAAKVVARR